MRKLAIFFISLIPLFSFSQYWEVGVFGGSSFYTGDLTESAIDFKELHPAFGGIVRYNVNQWFTIKGNAYYGKVSGRDANARTYDRKLRNLSFESEMLDVGMQAEINIRGYQAGHPRYNNTPYLLMGVSIFRFNPEAFINNSWYDLQPFGTEGQGSTRYNDREKYALTQVSLPIGVGWKYAINRYWNIGMEMGARITFTDYIDDVSTSYVQREIVMGTSGIIGADLSNRTGEFLNSLPLDLGPGDERGDPTKMDWYYFTGITISYNILPNVCYRF